jgi:hypothetical protein
MRSGLHHGGPRGGATGIKSLVRDGNVWVDAEAQREHQAARDR